MTWANNVADSCATGWLSRLVMSFVKSSTEGKFAQIAIYYDRYRKKYYVDELISVFAGFLLFCLIIKFHAKAVKIGGWANIYVFAIITLLPLVFRGPTFREASQATNIIIRVVAALLGFYVLLSGITYPIGVSEEADRLLSASKIVAIIGALGAVAVFKYPAFILVPCASVLTQKAIGNELFEVSISSTDYIPVVEIGLFIGSGLCVLGPLGKFLPLKIGRVIAAAEIQTATTLLFVVAIAVHFSNYFYSGLTKVYLPGGSLLWVTQNPTELLSLNAWLGGFLPLAHLREPSLAVTDLAGKLRPVINVSILVAQLGSILFILRRRSMILVTLFYDVTHVVIFLLSGIFFWKWILLNLGFVAAMRRLPRMVETPAPMVLGVAAVLLAPDFFHVARLGWYDTPALTRSELYAVTKAGQEIRVPSNYFGTISVVAAQHRLGRVVSGHFPTVTWGTTQSLKVFQAASGDCSFADAAQTQFKSDMAHISKVVQLTHAYALQQAKLDGKYHYDRFPHHIWSNPWLYGEFASLSPDEIDHYIYRTVSACVEAGGSGPVAHEHFRDEFTIPAKTELPALAGVSE